MSYDRRVWARYIGRRRFNRVVIFQTRQPTNVVMMEWSEGGRQWTRSLKHNDRLRAEVEAMEVAERLAAKKRRGHESRATILEMRADLLRVAAMQRLGPGIAPGYVKYAKHGRFSLHRIRAAFRGYGRKDPRDEWVDAVARFGLKPKSSTRITGNDIAADVRRVAMALGSPRRLPSKKQYDRLGKHHPTTAMEKLRVTAWVDLADALRLDIEDWRMGRSRLLRGRPRSTAESPQSEAA